MTWVLVTAAGNFAILSALPRAYSLQAAFAWTVLSIAVRHWTDRPEVQR